MSSKNSKVLMVVAHHNFRDEEYTSARQKLESAGAQITVASTVTTAASGSQGLSIDPDLLIDDVNSGDYDAVVFVGGTGASQYWHDMKAHEIITEMNARGCIIAATSHAPATIAATGLLKNKKATGHVTIFDKLQVAGADYTGSKLEQEGNIITSSGANAAKEFSVALAGAI